MITKNFFVCGLTGWCMEILFTSTGSFLKQDKRLIGRTSVWMFPIYGTAAVIAPLYHSIKNLPALLRGCIYSVGIFSFEYITACAPGITVMPKQTLTGSYDSIMLPCGWLPDFYLSAFSSDVTPRNPPEIFIFNYWYITFPVWKYLKTDAYFINIT